MTASAAIPVDQTQPDTRSFMQRFVTLQLIVIAFSAVVAVALTVYLLSAMDWVRHTERAIGNANEIGRLSADMESGMRGYVISGDDAFLQPYRIARPRIMAELAEQAELVRDNQAQSSRLRRVMALQAQWNDYAQNLIDQRRNNVDVEAIVRSGRGKTLTDEIRRELTDFIAVEEALLVKRSERANALALGGTLGYLLLSLGLGGWLSLRAKRRTDQLASDFADALRKQADIALLLDQQLWLRTGQLQLAEQTVGHTLISPLGQQMIEFLARYLDVAVGVIYVRQESGQLQRIASFGLNREQAQSLQSFHAGESLVGQAAQDKRVIQLDNLPANYLTVNSGLGQGKPQHVLVVPVYSSGRVNGVMELGFMRPLHPRDLDFVNMIAGNIGNSLHAALATERLQEVLQVSQALNEELQTQQEELQSQQEELRTTNEEIEERSRMLSEYQVTLENQQAELEQTNDRLTELGISRDEKNAALGEAQVELQARADELQRASRYKSEFLANMSHELRTPLNSSLILARLLADNPQGNLSDEQVKFAESISAAGNDLLNLINDILDISKVEAGKLELSIDEVGLGDLVSSLERTFAPLADQKALAFSVQVVPGTPVSLHTDRQRVEQILKNLLSNAIKFTDSGSVTLHVSQPGSDLLAFAVQDSGIGIRADQQQAIFNAFQQADGTTSRRYGGTGLGLSISRDLGSLLGGSISVQSTEGQGSCFTLLLPLAYAAAPTGSAGSDAPSPAALEAAGTAPAPSFAHSHLSAGLSPRAPAAIRSPRPELPAPVFPDDRHQTLDARLVLVVEDDALFAAILLDLAHELGYQCLVALDAEEALMLAGRFSPAAILLDMGLPDQSGLSLLQQFKDNPRTRHIPVHVVSGNDRREAAMQMGAIGYALKPTTRAELKAVFKKLEDKIAQKVKRILLVEDDELQRTSVTRLIEDDDVEITAVDTGAAALALLASHSYDCMIVDLKLPDIQGYELLQRMAEAELSAFPPVIVYTGRSLSRQEEADLLKYSHSIIIKGARSPERLLDEVTLFLHKVEAELSAERQTMLKTARSRDRVFEGRKILLVDDDVRNIFALTSALEQKGIHVEIGRNGFEAISQLDAVEDIDLVLMDVMMPGMDGLEATRRIRSDPRFQTLPIIAVTAKAMRDDQEQCLKAGTSDYLAKPVDLERLFALLRIWMPSLERI